MSLLCFNPLTNNPSTSRYIAALITDNVIQSFHLQKHCSPYRTPTMTEKATNTGISLLLLHCPETNDGGSGHDGVITMATENSTASSVTGMEQSMSTGEVSLKTETSVPGTSSINLDLCSFGKLCLQCHV